MKKNHITIAAGIIGIGSLIMLIIHIVRHEYHLTIPYAFVAYGMTHIVFYRKKPHEFTFEELEERRWNWAKKIFPEATAESSLIKAEKEMEEIRELLFFRKTQTDIHNDDALIEEYVDEFMCIFDSARRAGITPHQIKLGYHKKIEKNIARKWFKNDDNTYSHVKKVVILAIALFLGSCMDNTYSAQYKKVMILNDQITMAATARTGPMYYRTVTVTDSKYVYYLNFSDTNKLPFKKMDTLTALILN